MQNEPLLLQFALEHASDCVYWINEQSRILYVNQASCDFLERGREELLSLSVADIDPLWPAERWPTFWQDLKVRGSLTFETRHRSRSGREFPVRVSANFTRFDGHEYSFCFVRDLSEDKRAEEKVRESNELLSLVLDSVPEAVYGMDLFGRCTFCNPSCLRLLRYECAGDLLEKDMHALVHRGRTNEKPCPVKEYYISENFDLGHGTHVDSEVLWRADGTSFEAEYWSRPIQRGETIIGTVVTFIDITERRRAEQLIRESEKRYRLLFERNLAGVVRTSLDGRILECNPAGARMFGYESPEEILSTSMIDAYQTVSDREVFLQKLTLERRVTNHAMRFRRKNGDSIWAMLNAAMIEDESGVPTFIDATLVDISASKRAEETLRELGRQLSEQHSILETERNMLRALIDNIPDFIYVKDTASRFVLANRHVARVMGVETPGELLGKTDFEFFPPEIATPFYEDEQKVIRSGQPLYNREERAIDRAGNDIQILTTKVAFRDAQGQVTGIAGIGRDITENKRAEQALRQAEEKYRSIFEDAVVGIFQTTPDLRPISVNRAMAEMHGYDSPEQFLAEVSSVEKQLFVDPCRAAEIRQGLEKQGLIRGIEVEVFRRDGTKKWVRVNFRSQRGSGGDVLLHEGSAEDITERKLAEERVQFLAYYDALTGLPNRTLLRDRLGKALAGARRQKGKVALLFLDLDRFKIINDSLGHSVGDLVLRDVGERLRGWAREQDTVARLGGDEFVIVLAAVKDVPDAAVAAQRLIDGMSAEITVHGQSLSLGCSIGVSIFPDHGTDAETLIKNADAAMYDAKEGGRNRFCFFTPGMNAQIQERLALENNLRSALGRNELFLMYQPQFDIVTGAVTGLEALLRWQHPELGLVPPDKFIRIAENSGLIIPIGEWVLRTACSQARKWQDEGLAGLSIAVNVSAVQFRQEKFGELVRKVLDETGLAPQYLELELTESLLLAGGDTTLSLLQQLKAMGLSLAIDDFGTGYSSLSYLRRFPVSKLKIDRSFVREVAVKADDAAIATAIISMARSLNLKVIAEGVEDEAQMSFLRGLHCDEVQGYYCARPQTADRVSDELRKGVIRTSSAT